MKYTCDMCGMIYDEALGDPKHGIPAGTTFQELPAQYACPLCGAIKDSFLPADVQQDQSRCEEPREFWNNAKYSDVVGDSQR